jgi:hypothetical protein
MARVRSGFAVLLLTVALVITSSPAPQAQQSMSNFEADPEIQKIAEAYALDMIDYAKLTHGIDLDWSDDSVQQVERIAAFLHDEHEKAPPTDEQIAPFYKMLGSYIGELFRRNHGAEWGWVTLQGNRFPGMLRKPDSLFWPWGKALNRIVNGAEDNLWHYYRVLLR